MLVTYSNHALNQFLNFVKTFTDKIVRVGGKTEEGLEQFGLWEQLKSRPKLKGQWKINKRIEQTKEKVEACKKALQKF